MAHLFNASEMIGDFQVRGREVSRLEGFGDAAFAFSVTLLVVWLEGPRSINAIVYYYVYAEVEISDGAWRLLQP